jgi:hypothetical protein
MNEPAQRLKSHESKEPKYQQDHSDGPQHNLFSFAATAAVASFGRGLSCG